VPTKAGKTASGEPVAALSWQQVRAWRLRRHHLDRRAPAGDLLAVAAAVCGLHAQLMSSAELTLWARVDDLEPGAVARALWEERRLVKTWAMRGTLHLLPAAEFSLWQAALSTYRHYLSPAWFRYFGVDREGLEALIAAIAEALAQHPLTRDELADEVGRLMGAAAVGDKLRGSWGALLKPAAFRGYLCFAPSTGQNVRFTRPDRWLPDDRIQPVDPAAALRAVMRRFLAVSGPATREDVARWWGIGPAAAGRVLAALGEDVAPVDVEGTAAWMLASDVAEAAGSAPPRSVRLLPAFDQYVVAASHHAECLLPGRLRDRVYRPQGWLSPVLLVDGRMDGIWRHERKGGRLAVAIEPFVAIPAWARAEAEAEAERLARFTGGRLDLTWASS
jgi:uncharacterized protein YcaQ